MAPHDDHARDDEDEDLDAEDGDASPESEERDASSETASDDPDRASPEELHAFLSDPATRAQVRRVLARRLPPDDVDDVLHNAIADAKAARKRPFRAKMMGWLTRVALNHAARHLENERLRREHEAPMYEPKEQPEFDDADAHGDEPLPDRGDPDEPRYVPGTPEWKVEGFFIQPWLERQVANDARDRLTLECMLEKAGGKSYTQIARERGMTPNELHLRVYRFKEKYVPRWKRHRNRTLLPLLLLFGAALVALVVWLLLHLRRHDDIGPDRGTPLLRPPAPTATLSAPPRDRQPFDQALPTTPSSVPSSSASPPPRTPPAPRPQDAPLK